MNDLGILPGDLRDAQKFRDTLAAVYGETQAHSIIASMRRPKDVAFWINPLKAELTATARDELATYLERSEDVPGLSGVWRTTREINRSSIASGGFVYVQNPSSVLAVRILDPQPGEEILDLAAAPGGKAVAIAAAMNNSGRLAVVEPVKGRFHRMQANLARCGVAIAQAYLRDGRGVGRAVGERFDRVLLDAPCSSEARMVWTNPDTYRHWSARKVSESQRKQRRLLRSAFDALKPGGTLVYSTCSFSPEENELVVQRLLRDERATLEALRCVGPARAGLSTWQGKELDPNLAESLRIVPDDLWSGFYIAKIVKRDA